MTMLVPGLAIVHLVSAGLPAESPLPVTEEPLGELHPSVLAPVASDDGRRLAYVTATASRFTLDASSEKVDVYYGLPNHYVRVTWREGRLEYGVRQRGHHPIAVTQGREHFGQRGFGLPLVTLKDAAGLVVHGAEQGGTLAAVVDGEMGLEYDWIGPLEFSPRGEHFTYRAALYVVLDGREIGPYGRLSVIGPPRFSSDGRRIAYMVRQVGGERAGWGVVVDGETWSEGYEAVEEDSLTWSSDGERLAYVAALDRHEWSVVVDSVPGKAHPEIDPKSLVFSPDGSRTAYIARKPTKEYFRDGPGGKPLRRTSRGGWTAVVDGVEGPEFHWLGSLTFSPDSRHVAYAAGPARGSGHVFLDGQELPGSEAPKVGRIVFSPDSRRLAWVTGGDRRGRRLVIDGAAGSGYGWLSNQSVTFSADSRHTAFVAGEGKKRFVVADSEQGPEYDYIDPGTLAFTSDSMHVIYAAQRGEKWVVVVDGEPGPELEELAEGSPVVSPRGGRWAYAGEASNACMVVIDGQTPLVYDEVAPNSLHFSPDGEPVAFLASSNGKWFAIIDGVEGPPYDAAVANGPAWAADDGPDGPWAVEYLAVRGSVLHRVRHVPER